MNHIEEMMETVGVEPKPTKCQGLYNCEECENAEKINCYKEFKHPDFTPEKQFEIIKLIASSLNDFTMYQGVSKNYSLRFGDIYISNIDFTQALAQLTTELIKANELDKQEAKRILEE